MNNHVNNDQNINNHAHTTVSKEILAKIFADQKQRAANAAALEQTATILEETSTATAEQPAAFQSVSFAQTASSSPASVQRTISIPESAVTVNTYQGSYIGDEGSWYTDSEGFVGYYEQHYYYFTCSVDSQANGVTQTEFLEGQLRLASSNEFGGAKLFDVYSYDGEYLGSWWDAINVADTYLESTHSAEFMVVPAYGCEGAILFDKTGVTLNHTTNFIGITGLRYGTYAAQSLDIYTPDNLTDGVYLPVVITIHGGNWGFDSSTTKSYYGSKYPHLSAFLTGTCNCIQVNMEYRRFTRSGALTMFDDSGLPPYQQMLNDIQSVIAFITTHADTYHMDPTKIALMGHSAGGHLSMLYAYTHPEQISLVISEAGPTNFCIPQILGNNQWNYMVAGLIGVNMSDVDITADLDVKADTEGLELWKKLWITSSPAHYADGTSPFTLLVYSNHADMGDELGDDTVLYSQCSGLKTCLENNYAEYDANRGHYDFQALMNEVEYRNFLYDHISGEHRKL